MQYIYFRFSKNKWCHCRMHSWFSVFIKNTDSSHEHSTWEGRVWKCLLQNNTLAWYPIQKPRYRDTKHRHQSNVSNVPIHSRALFTNSFHGNVFRLTDTLWRESIGQWQIHFTMIVEFVTVFLVVRLNNLLRLSPRSWWFHTPWRACFRKYKLKVFNSFS